MNNHHSWTRRLDTLIDQLAAELRGDLYDNVIVPIVHNWFATWDSITTLNETIADELQKAWPRQERRIRQAFADYAVALQAHLEALPPAGAGPAFQDAGFQITKTVTAVAGVVIAAISGTLLGGGGVALLMSGPIGWVIGFVLGALAFTLGKKRLDDFLAPVARRSKIPPLLKRRAKTQIATDLTLNAPRFEDELRTLMRDAAKDLYRAVDGLPH